MIGLRLANNTFFLVLQEGRTQKKRLVLTTVHNDQNSVHIDLYRGESKSIDDDEFIASLSVEDIKPGRAGDPEVELVMDTDESGNLNARAVDRAGETENTLSVNLTRTESTAAGAVPDFSLEDDYSTPDELGEYRWDSDETTAEGDSSEMAQESGSEPDFGAAAGLDSATEFGSETAFGSASDFSAETEFGDSDDFASTDELADSGEFAGSGEFADSGDFGSGESERRETRTTTDRSRHEETQPIRRSAATAYGPALGIGLLVIGIVIIGVLLFLIFRPVKTQPLAVKPAATEQTSPQSTQPATAPSQTASKPAPSKVPETTTPAPKASDSTAAAAAPAAAQGPAAAGNGASGVWYRIARGDTLWDLAYSFYNNPWLYNRIATNNNIPNPNKIYSGSKIYIPLDQNAQSP